MKSEEQIRCMFKFVCPNQWHELQKTEQDDVKYCNECQQDVHWVQSEQELSNYAAQGHCVAYTLPKDTQSGTDDFIEVTMLGDPIFMDKDFMK